MVVVGVLVVARVVVARVAVVATAVVARVVDEGNSAAVHVADATVAEDNLASQLL